MFTSRLFAKIKESLFLKNSKQLFTSKKGNVLLTMIAAVGVGSVTAVVSSFDFIKTISNQRVALQQQGEVNAALASILDYSIYLVRRRVCFNDNLTIIPCKAWCETETVGGNPVTICKPPFDDRNAERLLFAPLVAKNLANYLNSTNLASNSGLSPFSFTDVMQSKIVSTAQIQNISSTHPLSSTIFSVRHFAKTIKVEILREDLVNKNAIPKGREVTLRFKVSLTLDGSTGFMNRVLKGTLSNDDIPELKAEALVTFFPREVSDFALMTSGNLVLANIDKDNVSRISSPTIADSFWPVMPKTQAGKGIVFQSPIFVNKSIYLQEGPPPDDEVLNEPNYSNVTFSDYVVMGDGIIYQNNSTGVKPFKPYSAGGTGSVYQVDNAKTFGGFLKGVRQEGFDNGLDCVLNQPYPVPSGNPCSLDVSSDSNKCIARAAALEDLTVTSRSQLVLKKTNVTTSANAAVHYYRIGLTPPDEFLGAPDMDLTRLNTASDMSKCNVHTGNNPCWSGSSIPASGTDVPKLTSTDATTYPLSKQKAIIAAKITMPAGNLGLTAMSESWAQADMSNRSQFVATWVLPTKSDLQSSQAQINSSIATQQSGLDQLTTLYDCLVLPIPSPLPSLFSPPSCGTSSSAVQIQAEMTNLQSSIAVSQSSSSTVNGLLSKYTSADNSSNPSIKVTLTTFPITFATNQFDATIAVSNAHLLWSTPKIQFTAYDAGVDSNGLNRRVTPETQPGPNPSPNPNVITYQLDPPGSPTSVIDGYPSQQWVTFPGVAPSSLPQDPPTEDLAALCDKLSNSQDYGTASFDVDFTSSSFYYWSFNPLAFPPGTPPDALIINAANDSNVAGPATQFKVYSVVPKCIIDQSATLVAGFMVCNDLYIDYAATTDQYGFTTVGKAQVGRSSPLEIIGTIIAGNVHISPNAIQAGVTWRNIYHPESIAKLRTVGILSSNSFCQSPTKPIWSKKLTDAEVSNLYSCSPSFLRDKTLPFQLTAVTPNCGLVPGSTTQQITCVSSLRSKSFKTINIFKQIGNN